MSKEEQIPFNQEEPSGEIDKKTKEIKNLFREERNRGMRDAKPSKKPNLDYYDNMRE